MAMSAASSETVSRPDLRRNVLELDALAAALDVDVATVLDEGEVVVIDGHGERPAGLIGGRRGGSYSYGGETGGEGETSTHPAAPFAKRREAPDSKHRDRRPEAFSASIRRAVRTPIPSSS